MAKMVQEIGMIGIKLSETVFNANIAKIMRKYIDDSISTIKKKVLGGEYLYICDYTDSDGINTIISIYTDMKKSNINSVILEHDEVTTVDFLNNLLLSYSETEQQVEKEIDDEVMRGEQQ